MTRREWMAALAKLTAPMQAAAASAALTEMLVLMEDLPPAAFTPASLEEVAAKCRRVPSYGELRAILDPWWRAHRPAAGPALAAPSPTDWRERYNIPAPRTPPTEAEKAAVAETLAKWRMQTAYAKSRTPPERPQAARAPAAVSDAQLLAVYDALGERGAVRAAALRAKLAVTA